MRRTLPSSFSLLALFALAMFVIATRGFPAAATAAPGPFDDVAKEVRRAVVTVRGYDRAEILLRERPGVFVGDRHIITVRRPLVGAHRAEVQTSSGRIAAVTAVLAEDLAMNLVLLELAFSDDAALGLSGPSERVLPWATQAPEVGALVLVVSDRSVQGDSTSGGFTVTAGTVIEALPPEEGAGKPRGRKAKGPAGRVFRINAEIGATSDGSPVVNGRGEVIGVAAIGYDQGTKKNIAQLSSRLSALSPAERSSMQDWSADARERIGRPARDLYASARVATQHKKLERARLRLEEAIMKAPGHQDAWLTLGFVYGQQERWQSAIEAFLRVTRLSRENTEAQLNLCIAYTHLAEWQLAKPRCVLSERLQPGHPQAAYHLGVAEQRLGSKDAAESAYRRAIAAKPAYPEAHYNLGALLVERGRQADAAVAFQHAVLYDDGYLDGWRRLGDVSQVLSRHEQAVQAYERAIALDKDDAATWEHMGRSWVALNRFGKALTAFETSARLKPDEARTFLRMGQVLAALRQTERAIDVIRHAIRLTPDYVSAHVALGEIYRDAGRYDEAIAALRAALALNAKNSDALMALGMLHVKKGEKDAAYEVLRALRAVDAPRGTKLSDAIFRM